MTKEEWIKIYTAKDGTWDKDDLIDKAYEIMTSPIRTNYDRIKNMSIEEMAECSIPFFNCPYGTPYVGCDMGKKYDDDCIKCTKAWLEQEVEE